jgi:hypothetical protein
VMDVDDMRRFLGRFTYRPGATSLAIAESEKLLGVTLPMEYTEFLKLTNGGEGFIGGAYAMLWGVEELPLNNRAYEVTSYAPGLLIFGSNGGGEAFGFDTRDQQWPIVQLPFIGMAWDVAWPMGASFSAFLKRLHETKGVER